MTLQDLLQQAANYYGLELDEVTSDYDYGIITKKDLLKVWLTEEGFFGYTESIWALFKALGEKD